MVKKRKYLNLQEPQRNRNGTGYFVNLIKTSTVLRHVYEYRLKVLQMIPRVF